MAWVLEPQMSTRLTPEIVCSRSTKTSSAKRVSSSRLRWSLPMASATTGLASASALEIDGGSTSGGRLRWARKTRSRTSLAARSRSAPRSNSTWMVLRPSRLVEVRVRMPSMPLIDSSSGSVICVSITSALAPR